MSGVIAADSPDPYDNLGELRVALLQRIATGIAALAWLTEHPTSMPCCWISFGRMTDGRRLVWDHRLCPDDCPHWHHEYDIWLAGSR